MATVQYNVIPANTADLGVETYSTSDTTLVNSFAINSNYNVDEHFIELHAYSVAGELLTSVYNYQNEKQLLNSAGAGQEGASTLYIDPVLDANSLGYTQGGVSLLYHFLRPILPSSLYISDISPDRTELRAKGVEVSPALLQVLTDYKTQLQASSYFTEFRLNFKNNDLFIGVNLDIETDGSVLVKLYEPLPTNILLKSTFELVELVADSVSYQVEATFTPEPEQPVFLKGPNFTLEDREQNVLNTGYLNYNELFSYPVTGSYHKLLLQASQSGIQVSIDYSDYSNFVHFSSAQERLENFKYKVGLVQYYESKSISIKNTLSANAPTAVSESSIYYDNLISGIVGKFDGYEQYLYFESTSFAWPKSNSLPPYINLTGSSATVTNWYTTQFASASLYDELNQSNLVYTVPEFIRQDSANAPYSLFLNMIGQHFDNIWIYAKAVTDKYDADNRLDYGISKDLVGEALRSFGVKLYSSNFSVASLSSLLLGEWYDSGSEQITSFVTASNSPTPDQDIIQETYKRLYHNLPYLIKTKGTERGLRALINCFGIPSGSLQIREFGGVAKVNTPYFTVETGSVDKIRLNNTGSVVPGNTLSQYVSIQNPEADYTQDAHTVEVGFSPTYYIDKYIAGNITGSFNIDDYIGDPRTAHDSSYTALQPFISSSLGNLSRYDMFDFIRLIKFFDNQVFKMVKDFVPARANVTTGIIIKPHLLERSKIKQPLMSFTQPEYTGSIDTAFIEGGDGDTIANFSTAYTASFKTPKGTVVQIQNTEVEKYNGELGGSTIDVVTGELNDENPFKHEVHPNIVYTLTEYLDITSPGAGFDELDEASFISQLISVGNMQFFWAYNSKVGYNYLKYIRFRNTLSEGTNVYDSVQELEVIKIAGIEYAFKNKTVNTAVTLLELADPGTGTSLNPASYPPTPTSVPVIFKPFLPARFDNSDYNPLLNNATKITDSAKLRKVDYTNGILVASNIEALRENTADFAEVQEYPYSSTGTVSGRYIGKQLRGEQINVYNRATDKSYGSTPVVEQTVSYFGTFSQMSATPDINNAVEVTLPYITFQDGEVYSSNTNSDAKNDIQFIFTENKTATVLFRTNTSGSRKVLALNGDYRIKKGGKRVEPILATQSGSINNIGKLITAPNDFYNAIYFGEDTGIGEYRLQGPASGSQNRATQVANSSTLNIYFATQSAEASLAVWDGTDRAYTLPSVEADTSIKYDTDLYFEFDRDGTGWTNTISVDVILESYNGTSWTTLNSRTIRPTWNRYGVKHEQPEGIDIVGHYKTSVGITKVFVKVSMSTGFIPFGDSGATQKLRTKVVNNSTGNDDVYLLDYLNGKRLGNKFTVEFRNDSRTADPNGEIRVIFGPKFQTLPFNLKSNFKVDQEVKPQGVVLFPDNTAIAPFAQSIYHPTSSVGTSITSGPLNPYIWVSASLTENFGAFQSSDQHESLGFKEFITPFSLQLGDEIRAEGNESKIYTIVDIWEKGDSRIDDTDLFAKRPDKGMVLRVAPPVPYGTILSNVLIRRYVDDSTKVLLYSNDPQTVDEFGTITPQYISQDLRTNFEKYVDKAFTLIQ
jgi:hypothetical protein